MLSAGVLWEAHILEAPNPWRLTYWLTGPVWLLILGWGVYQLTAFNYRMTTRRLFRARGWLKRPDQAELAKVEVVRMRRSPFERWLGLGRVYIDRGRDQPRMVLNALYNPERVAQLIRRQVEQARGE
jgi:hypothetical protein